MYLMEIMIIDATIYVGGLDDKVAESLMWELFVQSGPVGEEKSRKYNDNILSFCNHETF